MAKCDYKGCQGHQTSLQQTCKLVIFTALLCLANSNSNFKTCRFSMKSERAVKRLMVVILKSYYHGVLHLHHIIFSFFLLLPTVFRIYNSQKLCWFLKIILRRKTCSLNFEVLFLYFSINTKVNGNILLGFCWGNQSKHSIIQVSSNKHVGSFNYDHHKKYLIQNLFCF